MKSGKGAEISVELNFTLEATHGNLSRALADALKVSLVRQQAAAEALPVYRYAPGSRGPAEAAALPAGVGLSWIE